MSSKEKLKIVVDYAPSQADNDVVREGIIASNEHVVGERDKAFSIFLKNDSGKVFGGIQAFRDTESTYIDVLWVEESFQKQGYGTKLLGVAEREAIENGCIFSLVDTWDFQAEEFYLKNGYERIGEIKNYWHGHSKIFLRKKLKSTQVTALDLQNRKESLFEGANVRLCRATKEDRDTIQNLGRFYVYEMSRYCGFLPTWEVPSNGLFECIDLSSYCEKPDRHAFLVKVAEELAGFVLINKVGSTPDVDWNIGEFFIVSKFQGKGVGRHVAEQVFNQFPGVWETSQIPENIAAIEFWDTVVRKYSRGHFEKTLKIVPEPKPHPMIILKFTSQGNS